MPFYQAAVCAVADGEATSFDRFQSKPYVRNATHESGHSRAMKRHETKMKERAVTRVFATNPRLAQKYTREEARVCFSEMVCQTKDLTAFC